MKKSCLSKEKMSKKNFSGGIFIWGEFTIESRFPQEEVNLEEIPYWQGEFFREGEDIVTLYSKKKRNEN